MWNYITFGDPTDLYHPLPPESDKPGWQAPGKQPSPNSISTAGTNQTRSPKVTAGRRHTCTNTHTPTCTNCPSELALPARTRSEELIELSLNPTLRQGRQQHQHTQFRPYVHPARSENHIRAAPQALLSLRNPLPACQGVCTLNDHLRPYRGPVFIASKSLNPLQQCMDSDIPGEWCCTPTQQPHPCALILCTFCATFLVQCHAGNMRSMLRWWRAWLVKRPTKLGSLHQASGFWADARSHSAGGLEQERRWNFTWSCLREARWELGMDLDAEV